MLIIYKIILIILLPPVLTMWLLFFKISVWNGIIKKMFEGKCTTDKKHKWLLVGFGTKNNGSHVDVYRCEFCDKNKTDTMIGITRTYLTLLAILIILMVLVI